MGFGWMLLRMTLILAAVCALAYAFLRWGVKRLVPFDPDKSGHLQMMERLPVGPKRAILVVRAGGEYILVGSSEAGFERLARLNPDAWHELDGALDAVDESGELPQQPES